MNVMPSIRGKVFVVFVVRFKLFFPLVKVLSSSKVLITSLLIGCFFVAASFTIRTCAYKIEERR